MKKNKVQKKLHSMMASLVTFTCFLLGDGAICYSADASTEIEPKKKTQSVIHGKNSSTEKLQKPPAQSTSNVWDPLTLQNILDSADQFYPEIRASHAELKAAEGQVLSTLGYFDPTLTATWDKKDPAQYASELFSLSLEQRLPFTGATLGIGYEKSDGKFASYDYYKDTGSDGRIKGFLNLPLLRGFAQDSGRTKILSQQSKLAQIKQSYALTRLDASRLAGQRFFEWVAAVNRYRVLRGLLNLAEDRQSNLDYRVRKGDLAQIEVLENMRQIFARRTLTLQSEVLVRNTALQLSLFLREKNGTPQLPKIEQAPLLEETLIKKDQLDPADFSKIVETHPLLIVLDEQLKQKELLLALAKNQIMPKLDFRVLLQKEQGEFPALKNRRDETFAGLKLEFPLLNRDARGLQTVARFEVESLKLKRDFARDKLRVDLQKMIIESDAAGQVFDLTAKEVEFAKKVEQAERIRFQQGDSSLLMVNLREQDKAQAEIKHLDAFLEWKKRIMDVGYFRGSNITENESSFLTTPNIAPNIDPNLAPNTGPISE